MQPDTTRGVGHSSSFMYSGRATSIFPGVYFGGRASLAEAAPRLTATEAM